MEALRKAPALFRIWGVRHIRALIYLYGVERHYRFYRALGMMPADYDEDIDQVIKIWNGEL